MSSHGSFINGNLYVLPQLVIFVRDLRLVCIAIELAHLVLDGLTLLLFLFQSPVNQTTFLPVRLIEFVFLVFQELRLILNDLDL